jgi:hypothetical protein
MAVTSKGVRSAVAGALLAGAIVLWLSLGGTSYADTAAQTQDTTVTINADTISWGSGAGCVQDMGIASFGSMNPGTVADSALFKGCVTSNTPGWDVSAVAGDLSGLTPPNSISIYQELINVGNLSGSAASASSPCDAGCGMASPAPLVQDAARGTGGFTYNYRLQVPLDQVADTYTNTVTFTASN